MFSFKRKNNGAPSKGKRKKIKSFISKNLISKRQRFILSVIILSLGLFIAENFLGKSGLSIVFVLSVLTIFFLYFSLQQDLEDNFNLQIFILPFFYSLSVGLFYL